MPSLTATFIPSEPMPMKIAHRPTAAQIAARFGCTPEQVLAQFERNRAQLRQMAEQARRTGRRVNNYTAEQLDSMAVNHLPTCAA